MAAVDVNVARICARIGGDLTPGELLDPVRPAASNQAAMELGALVCRARSPRCEACPVAAWCASAGAVAPPPARRPRTERFEASNRYVRGRIVAAVHAGEPLPADIAPDRLRVALDGLIADGLVEPGAMDLPLG